MVTSCQPSRRRSVASIDMLAAVEAVKTARRSARSGVSRITCAAERARSRTSAPKQRCLLCLAEGNTPPPLSVALRQQPNAAGDEGGEQESTNSLLNVDVLTEPNQVTLQV